MGPRILRAPPTGPDGELMLTRAQTAHLLGMSVPQLRQWVQAKGILRSCVMNGVHWFTREEVIKHAQVSDPNFAAAFKLFSDGSEVVQVVMELNMDPYRVADLYAMFQKLQSCIVMQLPPTHSRRAWAEIYGVAIEEMDPRKLMCALEICLSSPSLHAQLEAMTRSKPAAVSRETSPAPTGTAAPTS